MKLTDLFEDDQREHSALRVINNAQTNRLERLSDDIERYMAQRYQRPPFQVWMLTARDESPIVKRALDADPELKALARSYLETYRAVRSTSERLA